MPVTVIESPDSRQATANKSQRRVYLIRGTADQAEALTNLANEVPATADGLVRKDRTVSPVYVDSATPDRCIWRGEVLYVSASLSQAAEPPATGDSVFSFDTGGGTQHITNTEAGKTTRYGVNAPNYGGAIGATADGVQGADIISPVYRFSETHYIADASVDVTYKGKLFALTGKTNNAPFRDLAAGECLFLGASGSKRGSGLDWEITFNFAASPNRTGLEIGIAPHTISGIAKKGHDLLDVHYAPAEDTAAKLAIQVPISVDVHTVYDEGDFADLGIG